MDLQNLLFDKFEPACLEIMQSMQKAAFLLLAAALVIEVLRRRAQSPESLLTPLLGVSILTGLVAAWAEIAGSNGLLWNLGTSLASEIEADAWTTYLEVLAENQDNWWNLITNPRAAITLGIIAVVGLLGEVVMVAARAFQFFFIGLILAFGPVFLSLLAFPATRMIGVNFLTVTTGLFLWDVAWKLVDLGTINLASASGLFPASTPAALLFIAGWVILGYVFAPLAVTKSLTAGGNIGGALLAASVVGGLQTAGSGAGLRYAAAGLMASNSSSSDLSPLPEPPTSAGFFPSSPSPSFPLRESTSLDGSPSATASIKPSGESQSASTQASPTSSGVGLKQVDTNAVEVTSPAGQTFTLPGQADQPGFAEYAQTQADLIDRKQEIDRHVQS